MQEFHIETPEQLIQLCDRLRDSRWLALDTEFVREKTYYPQFCLLQICNGEVAACVDPITIKDLQPLLDIIFDQKITKIFHAGRQDLEIFQYLWNRLPQPLFDTQLAATLLGLGDQIGYGNLVQKVLGVELEKGQARTDWSYRPLHQSQLRYALDDVVYLGEVYEILLGKLQGLGRESWLKEDFEMLATAETYVVAPMEAWQKVKGRQHLKGVQYAVLQTLAAWRENEAQRANKPKRWILKDEVMIELSRRQPKDMQQLGRIRGLEPGTLKNRGEKLLQLTQQGRTMPKAQWPKGQKSHNRLTPNQDAIADLLMCSLRLLAQENDITYTALASRKDLERMVTGDTEVELMHGWRHALAGEKLQKVLDGKLLPQLKDGNLTLGPTVDSSILE